MKINYCWTMTPKEMCSRMVPVPSVAAVGNATLPTVPFKGEKHPLEGTPYTYQYGVSDISLAPEIAEIPRRFPDVPLTGSRRAGIIIFHGNLIIASYIIPGNVVHNVRQIIVHENYRRQGLGTRMVEEWLRLVPGTFEATRQSTNIMVTKIFIKAHTNVVNWAIASGKGVPPRVREAVANGKEAEEVLAGLDAIENAPR